VVGGFEGVVWVVGVDDAEVGEEEVQLHDPESVETEILSDCIC
jgi:hypothetical protein